MAEEDIKSDINESKEGSEVSGSENEGDESKENISDSENTQQNGDSKKNGDSQKNGDVSEDDISDSEPSPKKKKGVALLDQPVERSGKRERTKTTELYVVEKKEEKELEFNGSGIALAEIPFIQDMIDNKNHGDDLKKLHSICFGRPGKKTTLKKTLRKFNGYTFDKSDAKFTTKQTNLEKTNTSELKLVCGILGLERGGTKAEIILRVLEFVIKPYDHKKEVEKKEPGKKKKSKSSKKKEGGKKRKRSDAGKPRGLKKSKGDDKENDSTANDDSTANGDSTADEENDDSTANGDDSTANEDSTAKDSSSSSSDSGTEGSDYEAEKKPKKTPAKKAVKTPAKKVASKTPAKKVASKTPAKKTPAKKTPAKKTPAKKTPAKSVEEVVDSDSSDDSDDEPLVKKKKVAPTNDEIKKKVEKILEGADLEEVTMKKVCQQVYDMYPGFDITDRKSIIKETVREIIS